MSKINTMTAAALRSELQRLDAAIKRCAPSTITWQRYTDQHQRLTWEKQRRMQHGGSLQPLRIPKRGRK